MLITDIEKYKDPVLNFLSKISFKNDSNLNQTTTKPTTCKLMTFYKTSYKNKKASLEKLLISG